MCACKNTLPLCFADGYAISETAAGAEMCKKSMILQITSKEYCLAKKVNDDIFEFKKH